MRSRLTKLPYVISSITFFIVGLILLLLVLFVLSFPFDDPKLRPVPTQVEDGRSL